jgi:hypothetical protein
LKITLFHLEKSTTINTFFPNWCRRPLTSLFKMRNVLCSWKLVASLLDWKFAKRWPCMSVFAIFLTIAEFEKISPRLNFRYNAFWQRSPWKVVKVQNYTKNRSFGEIINNFSRQSFMTIVPPPFLLLESWNFEDKLNITRNLSPKYTLQTAFFEDISIENQSKLLFLHTSSWEMVFAMGSDHFSWLVHLRYWPKKLDLFSKHQNLAVES